MRIPRRALTRGNCTLVTHAPVFVTICAGRVEQVIDKLQRNKTRYEELQALISDPEVIRDQKRYRDLRQEHAMLTEQVEEFSRYQDIEAQIASNRELAESDDREMKELAREELTALEARRAASEERLKVLLVPKDPLDDKNVIVEIRAGTGGDEAALFAADLFRMYSYYVDAQKWKLEIMSSSPTGIGGFKEIISSITGKGVYAHLRYESGVHRVQRVPTTEAGDASTRQRRPSRCSPRSRRRRSRSTRWTCAST